MIALPPKLRDHRALVSIRPATDRLLGSIDYIATVLAAFSGNRLLGSIHYIATVFHGRLLLATTRDKQALFACNLWRRPAAGFPKHGRWPAPYVGPQRALHPSGPVAGARSISVTIFRVGW